MSKKQLEARKRNYEKAQQALAVPSLSYKIQNKYELLVNLVGIVDDVIQDLGEDAPYLFKGSTSSFKELNRALDKCMECVRKDFYHEQNAELYADAATKIPVVTDMIEKVLWGIKAGHALELDTFIKTYIMKPSTEKNEKYNFAVDYLERHKGKMTEEMIKAWEEYIENNK